MNQKLAVLVGNGLSVAFNPNLSLNRLTDALVEKVSELAVDGSEAETVLAGLTSKNFNKRTFEKFVGALEDSNLNTQILLKLARNLSPKSTELHDAISKTSSFATTLRDWGISIVLETILERSQLSWWERPELDRLLEKLQKGFPEQLIFGNLNYDTILLTSMLQTFGSNSIADLTSGQARATVTSEGREIKVQALRSVPDFPKNRILHLNLHGSLQFWANEKRTVHVKLDTAMLCDGGQWQSVRAGTTNIRPVVVLTNQKHKTDAVREYPFALAYKRFAEALHDSNTWIIIGYSFTDLSVNEMLHIERIFSVIRPRVIVVTLDSKPTRRNVEKAFGWSRERDGDSSDWLTIYREGAKEFTDSDLLVEICNTPLK